MVGNPLAVMRQMKLGDSSFFYNKKHKMTRKNFMGSTTHASSKRRFHEFFSGRFELLFFVVIGLNYKKISE